MGCTGPEGEKMTVIVCRCEDITEEDILAAIEDGYCEIEILKRHLRIGMGPCQGKTCISLLERILKRELGTSSDKIGRPTARPPSRQVSFAILAGDDHE